MERLPEEINVNELFILVRIDTEQYYHSLLPRGKPLWVDNKEDSQYLTEKDAEDLRDFLYYSPYKHVLEIRSNLEELT